MFFGPILWEFDLEIFTNFWDWYQTMWNFIAHLLMHVKSLSEDVPTYPNAHTKVKKWIFELRFQGNWFEFIVIVNDFWSSTILAIQIKVSFAGFKILKFPKFNLNMPCRYFRLSSRFLHCVDFIICVNFRNYHVQ